MVVIGSGATAVTLVPAMAERAAHVTMLQRSPTYVMALPSRDVLADALRRWLPAKAAYPVVRWKNVLLATANFQLSRRAPGVVSRLLRRAAKGRLPVGYDIDRHFSPRYDPWDQRLCVVPDGDLFTAMRAGRASVVTDTIDTFTEHGIRLASGDELPADIVVTATGLNLLALGGMTLTVDGAEVDLAGHGRLQGHDALRGAELRHDDRLHQRLLDAEGRPGRHLRLPAAAPPGPAPASRSSRRSRRRPASWCRSST